MPRNLPLSQRARVRAACAVSLSVLVAVAGCGKSDANVVRDGAAKFDKVPTASTAAPPTTLPDAKNKPCKPAVGVTKAKGKPVVSMPARPPSKLVVKDLKVGTGPAAKLGDTIKVNYIGLSCSTGKQFDASYDRGQPVEFPLQAGGLIKGWVEGIPGMKVGGQRQLTIPPSLGYGAQGNQGIAPNETLVFVIDLISTTPASQTTTTGASSTTGATSASTAPSTTSTTAPTTTAAPSTTGG